MNADDSQPNVTALQQFARWLVDDTGTQPPPDRPMADVDGVIARALEILEPIDLRSPDCRHVSSLLAEYVALGADAATRMPGIARHLESCEACSIEYRAHEHVHEDLDSWRALARAAVANISRLVWSGQAWTWRDMMGRLLTITSVDLELGRSLGRWRLQPIVTSGDAMAFGEARDRASQVSLTIALDAPRVQLTCNVSSQFVPTHNQSDWFLRIELGPGEGPRRVRVGLGNAERATRGWRTLEHDRPAEFSIDPPGAKPYWLRISNVDDLHPVQHAAIEIPLAGMSEDVA
jgi:hypothetical protein